MQIKSKVPFILPLVLFFLSGMSGVWMRKRQVSIVFTISALFILFCLASSSLRSLVVLGTVSVLAILIYMMGKLRERVHFSAKIWALIVVTAILGFGIFLSIILAFSQLNFVQIDGNLLFDSSNNDALP